MRWLEVEVGLVEACAERAVVVSKIMYEMRLQTLPMCQKKYKR